MSNGTQPSAESASQNALPPVQRASDWAKMAGALVVLGGSIQQLWKQIQSDQDQDRLLVGVFFVAAVGALGWLSRRLRRWLSPGSRLLKPSALDIRRRYLYGRDTDVGNLLGRLKDFPLVWLVGESGAGKSSLLELGLVPRLHDEPSFHPIYLDHWGADWIEGPRQGLRRALNETLDDDLREVLGLEGPVGADQALTVLEQLHDEQARVPVLIFDQFDDYQTRHRQLFLRGDERKILTVRQLFEENPYWRDVARLLEAGKVRCVFVTRTDMQWGLDCVRVREPETYLLGRLESGYAAELLDAITPAEVIARPERSWEGLRKRLLDDLGTDGWVLPIRMKFAFRGLAGLEVLSVGHYEREGGLAGLEALDVKRHVAQAARHVAWSRDHVRRLLLEMIEPESRSKAVARTEAYLLDLVPEADRDEGKLRQVLKTLQDADIVRQRLDPDQDGGAVWLLYHDYLCAGVLELDRRAREWQIVLEEAVRVFEGARGIVGKWKALLNPALQLRLATARLRGRLSFGRARRFVAFSTLRVVVNVWVVLLLAGFYVWRDLEADRTAQDLLNRFTFYEETSVEETGALWMLSGERTEVRKAFVEIFFKHPQNAKRFLKKPHHILQGAVGLNQGDRHHLLAEIIEENCYRAYDYEFSHVCRFLFDELPRLPETTGTLEIASNRIVELMAVTEDRGQWFDLLSDLRHLGEKLPSEAVAKAANRIVELMAETEDPSQLFFLSAGLGRLGEKLPSEAIVKAANRIVEFMAETEDPSQLSSLSEGLGRLGEKLPSEATVKAANQIVEFMAVTENPYRLFSLSAGLGRLGEKLPSEAARQSLQSFLATIHPLPKPPCGTAMTLIRKDNLQPIIELLKWPTCSGRDRNQLIKKITQVTGQSFGETIDGEFQPDMWTFIEWAEKEGYEPGRPPKPPESVRSAN